MVDADFEHHSYGFPRLRLSQTCPGYGQPIRGSRVGRNSGDAGNICRAYPF